MMGHAVSAIPAAVTMDLATRRIVEGVRNA